MQKIRKNSVLFLALIAILILGFPAYADPEGQEGQAPANLEQTKEGNSTTGEENPYKDKETEHNYRVEAGQTNLRDRERQI